MVYFGEFQEEITSIWNLSFLLDCLTPAPCSHTYVFPQISLVVNSLFAPLLVTVSGKQVRVVEF